MGNNNSPNSILIEKPKNSPNSISIIIANQNNKSIFKGIRNTKQKKKHRRTGPTILKFKQNKTLDYCEYVCMQNLLTKEQRNKSKQRVGILTRVVENNQ